MSSKIERVELINGEIVVNDVRISDAVAIAQMQKHAPSERADALRNTVQLGSRVLAYASDNLGAAEIAERIEASTETATKILHSATTSAREALESQIGVAFGKNGRMEALLARQLSGLARDLEKHLDPQTASSVLGKFSIEIRNGWTENATAISKLLDLDQPGSVSNRLASQLEAHHKVVSDHLVAIMREVAARNGLRAERIKGTIKGALFEDTVECFINAWAVARHDQVTACANIVGSVHNSKAGDFTVDISARDAGGPGLRLVIEARDRVTGVTQARRDLDRAVENRSGAVGIYVTTDSNAIPKGAPPVYFLDCDRVFVAVDNDDHEGFDPTLLNVALEVARARAITSRSSASEAFDLAAISVKVTAAINATTRFSEIKKQLSGIGTGIERVKTLVDDVRTDLRGALDALRDEIDKSANEVGRAA